MPLRVYFLDFSLPAQVFIDYNGANFIDSPHFITFRHNSQTICPFWIAYLFSICHLRVKSLLMP